MSIQPVEWPPITVGTSVRSILMIRAGVAQNYYLYPDLLVY